MTAEPEAIGQQHGVDGHLSAISDRELRVLGVEILEGRGSGGRKLLNPGRALNA